MTSLDPDEQVTLGFFADHVTWEGGGRPDRNTVAQYRGHPGFPEGRRNPRSRVTRYRVGDLVAYFNSRPGKSVPGKRPRAPPRADTAQAGGGPRARGSAAAA